MQIILSCAVVAVLVISLVLLVRCGRLILTGRTPTRFFAFFAILFTSGLDVGLIMFPLTEFPIYEARKIYGFTNPIAIEFGFWGFYIWLFYFLTTFYFCLVEPRLKIFEIPWVKKVNNATIIATCAFTGYLFLQYLPDYVLGISPFYTFTFVGLVVLAAVISSTDIRYLKILSLASTWLFFALIIAMWAFGGLGFSGLATNMAQLADGSGGHYFRDQFAGLADAIVFGKFASNGNPTRNKEVHLRPLGAALQSYIALSIHAIADRMDRIGSYLFVRRRCGINLSTQARPCRVF